VNKPGGNDPCPCGSGKKYKKCCLTETFIEIGREESIRKRLVDELMKLYEKNFRHTLDEAHILFWDDFLPQEHLDGTSLDIAYQNFFEWITFDFIIDVDENSTLIDLYIKQKKNLSVDEHRVLTVMKNSIISLYEVQEVFPEKGLLLKDLLLGGEFDVKERSATRDLKKWDIYAARLLHIDGQYVMSGSVYPYSLKYKERILDDILGEYEEYKEEHPAGTMDMFLKESGDIFNFHWYFPIQYPPPLKLHTTSGEPMLFSKAVFEIRDGNAVTIGLSKVKGFEQGKDDFIWYDKRNKEGSATILGRAEIKGDKLILECNSKKRLERGKKMILGALSNALVHKIDTFQDPMEAIKSHKGKSQKSTETDLPMELQQQIYTQFMQKHCEKWINEKIPALDGKTPVQAARTYEGKKKVIDLLKLFENGEERNKKEGRPYYDLTWMWERLGLEKE